MTPPNRYTCRPHVEAEHCAAGATAFPPAPTWQPRAWGQRAHLSLGAAGVLKHNLGEAAVALHHLNVVLYVWQPPHTTQVSATARPCKQAPASTGPLRDARRAPNFDASSDSSVATAGARSRLPRLWALAAQAGPAPARRSAVLGSSLPQPPRVRAAQQSALSCTAAWPVLHSAGRIGHAIGDGHASFCWFRFRCQHNRSAVSSVTLREAGAPSGICSTGRGPGRRALRVMQGTRLRGRRPRCKLPVHVDAGMQINILFQCSWWCQGLQGY